MSGTDITDVTDAQAALARLTDVEVGEVAVPTASSYRLGEPVVVFVRRRGHRYDLDDAGAAVALAGRPPGWLDAITAAVEVSSLNVNRSGLIFVPVGEGRDLDELAHRVGETSRRAYLALLDLRDGGG